MEDSLATNLPTPPAASKRFPAVCRVIWTRPITELTRPVTRPETISIAPLNTENMTSNTEVMRSLGDVVTEGVKYDRDDTWFSADRDWGRSGTTE